MTDLALFDVDVPSITPDDSPRVRRKDPLTSHATADLTNLTDSRTAVMAMLRKHGRLAAFELEEFLPVWSPSRIRTALTELAEAGWVLRLEETRLSPWGRSAHVWAVSS